MDIDIKPIIVLVVAAAMGVWCFMAGLNGWKYPRLKFEVDDDNEKIGYQLLKIIVGAGLVIAGIGGIITELIVK